MLTPFPFSLLLWLWRRGQDAARWPLTLLRDWPLRLARLLRTLRSAPFEDIPLETAAALRLHSAASMKTAVWRTLFWLHRLLCDLFDLGGGPELLELLLRALVHTSALTPQEQAAATAVFGPEGLRYRDVRIAQGGLLTLIFRYNGNLAFATWHTIHLPRNGRHARGHLPLLIHELTHVYQYERVGSRYLGEAIAVLVGKRRDCYAYGGAAGLRQAAALKRPYAAFNREQQAMVVQDYYTAACNQHDVEPFLPFVKEMRNGRL